MQPQGPTLGAAGSPRASASIPAALPPAPRFLQLHFLLFYFISLFIALKCWCARRGHPHVPPAAGWQQPGALAEEAAWLLGREAGAPKLLKNKKQQKKKQICSCLYVLSHGVRRSHGTSPYEAVGDGGAAAPREAGASRLRLHPAAASPWRCCGCFSILCPSVPVPARCPNSTLPAARVPGVPAGGPWGPGSGHGAGGARGHGEMGAVVGGWRLWCRTQPVWGQGKGLKESRSQGCEIQAVCEAGSPRPAEAWVGFPIGYA